MSQTTAPIYPNLSAAPLCPPLYPCTLPKILVSSANFSTSLIKPTSKSSIKTRNRIGPNTDPWGIPLSTLLHPDQRPPPPHAHPLPSIQQPSLDPRQQSSRNSIILQFSKQPVVRHLVKGLCKIQIYITSTLPPLSNSSVTLSRKVNKLVKHASPKPMLGLSQKPLRLQMLHQLISHQPLKYLTKLTRQTHWSIILSLSSVARLVDR